jgi:hypothetical protein
MLRARCPALLLLAAVVLITAASATAAQAATLRPVADGSLRRGTTLARFDHRSRLIVDGAPTVRSWVTFRLGAPAATARLSLFVLGGRRDTTITVRAVSDRLVRRALLGRSRKAGTFVGRFAGGRRGRWVSVDVSRATRRAGLVRLVLTTGSRRARVFSSAEGRHAPILSLDSAAATPPGGSSGPPPTPPPPVTPPKSAVTPPVLGPPTRFVAPSGNDAGTCGAGAPCRSFDRAYHVASPGEVVEIAGGSYGAQTFTADAKTGTGCSSAGNIAACVAFEPAAGSTVSVPSLTIGANYYNAGPGGIAIVATADRKLQVGGYLTLNRPRELATWGISAKNFYITGGSQMAVRGGDIGGIVDPDGSHPEIQASYINNAIIELPTNLTIEGVSFHDINTSHPTAHTDCLQLENGTDIILRANRFERCGSVGLRMSWGSRDSNGPPTNVLIENNVFGKCADIPVSQCYYSAQPGNGINVTVRYNTFVQAYQPSGGPQYAKNLVYIGNLVANMECDSGASSSRRNVTAGGSTCGPTDRKVTSLGLINPNAGDFRTATTSAAVNAGDPGSFPAMDAVGTARPLGSAPDAGAYEVG